MAGASPVHSAFGKSAYGAASLSTDGDQHQRQQTMRVNHAVFDPIFMQYIINIEPTKSHHPAT
jgi:hypothetical protein